MNIAGQSVTGMAILAGAAILILFILVIRLYAKMRKAQGEAARPEAAASAVSVAPAVEPGIDPAVVAAIAAVVAALSAEGGAGSDGALVVRSIRRASGWARAARAEQVYRF